MLKFLAVLLLIFLIIRFVARFFLWSLLGKSNTHNAFNEQNHKKASPFSPFRRGGKPDFDRIQDADFEDVTERTDD
jgi:hypothetical protein